MSPTGRDIPIKEKEMTKKKMLGAFLLSWPFWFLGICLFKSCGVAGLLIVASAVGYLLVIVGCTTLGIWLLEDK